jgi:hypothetical protein
MVTFAVGAAIGAGAVLAFYERYWLWRAWEFVRGLFPRGKR